MNSLRVSGISIGTLQKDSGTDFPADLVRDYAAGRISRQAFIAAYEEWQVSHGIDLRIKGRCDNMGSYLEYRGSRFYLSDLSNYFTGRLIDVLFVFCRSIDRKINRRLIWQNSPNVKRF